MNLPIPTIKDVTARAVEAPLPRPIKTSVGTIPSAPLVLIDVVTDQDIVGRAYIFGYTPVTLRPLVDLIANLRSLLLGKSVSPFERMRDFNGTFRLLGRQGLLGMAISGLDMALWDALGRAHEQSVCRLLGGDETPVLAYDSYGVIDPRHDIALLENSLEQGFTAIKIKIGNGDLRKDVETVSAVREAIGADTRLMVDYNQSLTVPEAVRRINRLAEYDLQWVEEPVTAEDLSGHAAVRARCKVAIQTGENWWFPEDIARAIAAGASDFAMLDIMKIGGVTGWLRAAGQAEGASLPVSSHLFIEASAQVLAVTPSAHYLEYLDVAGAILSEPLKVEHGKLRPRGPGLGLDWDARAVNRYAL
ncbi:MAG: mandelate racemase [Rhodospirillales bacterium]|nr:mandelate racemase [Rhodospirillales bacterium]